MQCITIWLMLSHFLERKYSVAETQIIIIENFDLKQLYNCMLLMN